MKIFRLFGLTLASDFPWRARLASGAGPLDLTFSCAPSTTASASLDGGLSPAYVSPYRSPEGETLAMLYGSAGLDLLRFPRLCDFELTAGHITCRSAAGETELPAEGIEIRLLGPVLAYWLEKQGLPVLHASAVLLDGRAVLLVAAQGGGKSGLAASLMAGGAPLSSDDLVAVEEIGGTFRSRPSYPEMRMWPDEAAHFLGSTSGLGLVEPGAEKRRVPVGPGGFGTFVPEVSEVSEIFPGAPIAGIYLLERRAPEGCRSPAITPLSRREALIELVRHSFLPHLVEAVGLQPARLDLLSRLVRDVPVRRLLYPSGFARLPEVAAAVRQDLARS